MLVNRWPHNGKGKVCKLQAEKSIEENFDHYKRYNTYRRILQSICPESGRDNTLGALDFKTPSRFDNLYFQNIIEGKSLLHSDNVLVNEDLEGEIRERCGHMLLINNFSLIHL